MRNHSEFMAMSDRDQRAHLQNTMFPALAINFAFGETCPSGADQFEFFGQRDAQHFLDTFGQRIGVDKLKKIDVNAVNVSMGSMMPPPLLKEYIGYAKKLKPLVQDRMLFKVFRLKETFWSDCRLLARFRYLTWLRCFCP